MRVEHEGGAVAWFAGTLEAPSCRDPGGAKCPGTTSAAGVMALSESFFKPLGAGNQKASLASFSPYLCWFRHLEGSFAWGPSLLLGTSGT